MPDPENENKEQDSLSFFESEMNDALERANEDDEDEDESEEDPE